MARWRHWQQAARMRMCIWRPTAPRFAPAKQGTCLIDATNRTRLLALPGSPGATLSQLRLATSDTASTSSGPEGIVRARRDESSLIDPGREANLLVSALGKNKLPLPPSRIKNDVLSLLTHLAINPRKDGGPIATRLVRSVTDAPSESVQGPNVRMFQLAIEAWIKSEIGGGSVGSAEELLLDLLSDPGRWRQGMRITQVDAKAINSSFAIVVHSLLRVGAESLQRVRDIVSRMKTLYADEAYGLKPNVTAMNAILSVLRQSNETESAEEARELLERMVEVFQNDPGDETEPKATSFNIVIHHFSLLGNVAGAKGVLRWMDSLYDEGIISTKSDLVSYNSLLDGLSKSNSPNAVEATEHILSLLEESNDIKPDAVSYSCCITAHARSGNAERAERLLCRMVERYEAGHEGARPDVIAFATCVDAWARVGGLHGARRAEALVGLQEDLHESGGSGLQPSIVTYNTLINAWAHGQTRDGGDRAMNILNRIESTGLRPNVTTYNTVLTALARSRSERSMEKAEQVFRQIETADDVFSDVITYNAYLDCLARSGDRDASERALAVLSRMDESQKSGPGDGVVPSRITYNTVMNVLARGGKRGAAQQAMGILEMMEDSREDERIRPDTWSYTSCISAWARSSEPSKIQCALDVFRRMEASFQSGRNDVRPTVVAYNAVLSACCFPPEEKDKAVNVAQTVMKELREGKYGRPDHVSYGTVLKIFGTALKPGPERDELVAEEFRRCCADGHLSDLVLKAVQKAASPSLLADLLPEGTRGKGALSFSDLPKDWCRNGPQSKKKRR